MFSTFWIYWMIWVYIERTNNILNVLSTFRKYWTCIFNFSDSVLCDQIVSIFSLSHSGKMWSHGLSILWMSRKYADSVLCDHMTQYILNVTTKEWLKHFLVAFFGKFKNCWTFTDRVLCGHMTQYFLNFPTVYWAGKSQSHCTVYSQRTQHVLGWEMVSILDI